MSETMSIAAPDGSTAEAIAYPDFSSLISGAAETIAAAAVEAIAERGRFTIALSGGNTPRPVYQRLAAATIDWSRVHVFFGDERCVSPRDARSQLPHGEGRAPRPRADPVRARAAHARRRSSRGGGGALRRRTPQGARRRRQARSGPARPRPRWAYRVAVSGPRRGDRDAADGDGVLRRVRRHVAALADAGRHQRRAPRRVSS